MRTAAAKLVVDHRGKLDLAVPLVLAAAYLVSARSKSFDAVLAPAARSSLYSSLTATTGALLGFSLTALAILVALPSTERLEALRDHPGWPRVPGSFFRGAWALFLALILCTLGVALDAGLRPARGYETIVVVVLGLALIRVAGAVVALNTVMGVARNASGMRRAINDPGP